MKIKINDNVEVIKGKDRGKNGKVIQVFPKNQKVVVEGLGIIKKHMRPNRRGEKGQIIELSGPIQVSNVMFVCPKCNNKTRTGYKIEGKKKERYCKKCGEIIE
ncbi:MAG: 50S ribosomal protein L24 [Parcubacteria group bacterium]|nr:50S ribosomal protein L24 [Parcubacteria group bacterium]